MKRAIFFLLLMVSAVAGDPALPKSTPISGAPPDSKLPSIPAKDIAKFNALHGNGMAVTVHVAQGAGQFIHFNGGNIVINGTAAMDNPSGPDPGEQPMLRWKNGETIHGDIGGASAGDVTWKTPLFEDPLQIRWDVIDRIEWPTTSATPTGPFGIAMRDGSFIYGDVVAVSADSISIHSARHGDAVLKRSEVLSARRLQHGSLLYSGPTGDVGWQPMAIQQDGNMGMNQFGPDYAPALATGPGGALRISSWNRSGRLGLTLPDSAEVEFRISTLRRPDFMLALGGTPHAAVRVETWDDELVLAVGEQFKVIRKIDDGEREVALRVCWDKKAQKCAVYSAAGELLTDWNVPGNISSTAPGLVVMNKGLELSLDDLQVREWDGKPPAKLDPKQPHVELADGRCVAGEIVAGAPGAVHLQVAGQTAPTDFALADVDALQFSAEPPQVPGHEATLLYNDGSILFGSLDSIANGSASLTTSFTAKPLSSRLDLLRQMFVRTPTPPGAPPEKPLANLDKLVIEQTALHGTLGTAGDNSLGWIPVGGVKASRPAPALPSTVTRYSPGDAPAAGDAALFYLASGDVLPGSLGSLDRTGAEFASSFMTSRKIPAAELNAIKFGLSARLDVKGFKDPGWEIVRGDDTKVHRDDNGGLQMEPGTAIGFPSLMQSSEISFKFISNGLSAARLRMFSSKNAPDRAINLLLGSTGNQFITGLESTPGQFDSQVQIKTNPGDPVNVRLEVGEDQVELFVNDISQQHIPIDPARRAGSGLVIEPAGIWGNNSFPVSLSSFAAHSGAGRTWLPDVSDDIRNQVLTVPRFQKDDPPQHLLLAENGDVLRGEVVAATATHFGFRCGLEELNVPRDRVDAVIWLKPAEANPTAPIAPQEKPAANPLDHRIQARIMFRQVGLTQLVSFLQGQDGDLKIKLPETVPPRRIAMQVGNQTVGEMLDLICSRFDLRYRVDTDGAILLEPAAMQAANNLATRTYWLKPDAIPKSPTIEEVLAAKGITFAKDASVRWDPDAGLLSMVNTADNQTRLAALVASDFGGSEGSPTHWLQLTSGGRFALAVDKIAPDFISGHHPIYGEVKVPMAQIYVIRTTPPPPSSAIKSLQNWRLVNAPDPMLPEGGGETSPLLGKDAPTFQLPLLAGGDFDLGGQKGKIVVLDFWATWCGPCVKSLPGLIDAIAAFPADRVKLIGVNQGEPAAQVTHFLETRGLKLDVALDADQTVGQKYGADAIPRTVIIGPDGKVAWVQTGYSEDEDTEASDVIKKLLAAASAANTAPDKSAQ